MQAMRFSFRYFNFCHLHRFAHCSSILNSNISRKCWKIANFRNQKQLSFPFCTFRPDHSQQNVEAVAEKQATEPDPDLVHIGQSKEEEAKNVVTLRGEKLDYILSNGSGRKRALIIRMQQSSKNGHKWIQLSIKDESTSIEYYRLAKIAVPKDAYLFLNAIDKLMNISADDKKPPFCHEIVKGGLFYDYKLGISREEDQFCFTMETIKTEAMPEHKPKLIFIPIHLLPFLRNQMAKMLAEFDGTEEMKSLPPLPKWITENDEKTIGLTKLKYSVDVEPQQRMITIKMEQGINGNKYIGISLQSLNDQIKFKNDSLNFYFSHIPVPEDAYPLLNAMCELSKELEEKQANGIQQNNSSLICLQMVKGLHYDYKLEIHLRRNQQLAFKMETLTTDTNSSHKPKQFYGPIPIDVFYWMKNQMAEMLLINCLEELQQKKNQQIGPIPSSLPKSINEEMDKVTQNKSQLALIRSVLMNYTVTDAEPRDRRIRIQFKQGKSGRKFIKITQADKTQKNGQNKNAWSLWYSFSSIPLPEDAYPLLKAMLALDNDLQLNQPHSIQQNHRTLICRQMVKGLLFDYKLEIHLRRNQQLDFRMETIKTDIRPTHKPRNLKMPIPIEVFHWLKDQLTQILLLDLERK